MIRQINPITTSPDNDPLIINFNEKQKRVEFIRSENGIFYIWNLIPISNPQSDQVIVKLISKHLSRMSIRKIIIYSDLGFFNGSLAQKCRPIIRTTANNYDASYSFIKGENTYLYEPVDLSYAQISQNRKQNQNKQTRKKLEYDPILDPKNGFKLLTRQELNNDYLYSRLQDHKHWEFEGKDLIVYTDGSSFQTGEFKHHTSGYAVVVIDRALDIYYFRDCYKNSNNIRMEYAAILYVMENLLPYYTINLHTDFEGSVKLVNVHLDRLRSEGYKIFKSNKIMIKKFYKLYLSHKDAITIKWVKAHSGNLLNELADRLADYKRCDLKSLKTDIT